MFLANIFVSSELCNFLESQENVKISLIKMCLVRKHSFNVLNHDYYTDYNS